VRALLNRRVDLNLRNNTGFTALMIATHEARLDVVQALLEFGANTRLRNKRRETAVDIAQYVGDQRIAQVLQAVAQ
jgi:ankyrin repeat protein